MGSVSSAFLRLALGLSFRAAAVDRFGRGEHSAIRTWRGALLGEEQHDGVL